MSEEAQGESLSHDDNADSSTAPEANTEVNVEASASESEEKAKKPNRVQERINQLTTKNYEEKQRNAQLEERIKSLESGQPAKPANTDLVAPNEDDFDTQQEYHTANAKYYAEVSGNAADVRVAAGQAETTKTNQNNERQVILDNKKKVFEDNVASKLGHFQDFNEIVYGHEFMDMDLAEQIFDIGEKAPEVGYFLGSNLDEAQRIHALNPVQRARELTKLEFQVEALSPKKVSDAPEPINTLGNSEVVAVDEDNMSADEWREWRNKQVNG